MSTNKFVSFEGFVPSSTSSFAFQFLNIDSRKASDRKWRRSLLLTKQGINTFLLWNQIHTTQTLSSSATMIYFTASVFALLGTMASSEAFGNDVGAAVSFVHCRLVNSPSCPSSVLSIIINHPLTRSLSFYIHRIATSLTLALLKSVRASLELQELPRPSLVLQFRFLPTATVWQSAQQVTKM